MKPGNLETSRSWGKGKTFENAVSKEV